MKSTYKVPTAASAMLSSDARGPACLVLERLGLAPRGYAVATVHRAESTDSPEHLGAVLAMAAVVIIGKALFVTSMAVLTGQDVRTSVQTGLTMAQMSFLRIDQALKWYERTPEDWRGAAAYAASCRASWQ